MEKYKFEYIEDVLSETLIEQIKESVYSGFDPDMFLILKQIAEYEEKNQLEFMGQLLGKFIFKNIDQTQSRI